MLIIKFQIIFVLGLFFSPILIAQKNDSVSIQIENFGNSVNTSNEEYAPVISADGSLLMFTTKRASMKKKKKNLRKNENNHFQILKMNGASNASPSIINSSSDGGHG